MRALRYRSAAELFSSRGAGQRMRALLYLVLMSWSPRSACLPMHALLYRVKSGFLCVMIAGPRMLFCTNQSSCSPRGAGQLTRAFCTESCSPRGAC